MRQDGTAGTLRDFLPLSAVCAVGLTLAVTAFITVRGYYQTQAQQQFRRSATYYSTSFKDDVARHVTSLAAIRAFVSASKGVSRWEFSTYAHQILPQNLGFRAVLWVPAVSQAGRAAYETSLQAGRALRAAHPRTHRSGRYHRRRRPRRVSADQLCRAV